MRYTEMGFKYQVVVLCYFFESQPTATVPAAERIRSSYVVCWGGDVTFRWNTLKEKLSDVFESYM